MSWKRVSIGNKTLRGKSTFPEKSPDSDRSYLLYESTGPVEKRRMSMFTGISLGVVVAIIAVIALLGIIASGYVKAPPDTAYIISGLRKKIIIGKSSI